MSDRLTMLEERVAALERALAERQAAASTAAPGGGRPSWRDHPLLRRSVTDPKVLAEHSARVLKALGIDHLEPIGAAEVRRMMVEQDGIDPNGNEFSRGIIEMREE